MARAAPSGLTALQPQGQAQPGTAQPGTAWCRENSPSAASGASRLSSRSSSAAASLPSMGPSPSSSPSGSAGQGHTSAWDPPSPWCEQHRDTALVQRGQPGPHAGCSSPHIGGVQRAVPEGHTSPCVYRRGHPHRGLQVPRSRALPRAVPCMPPPGCACPTAVTCLELDGPQHLCHIVHIDGEVVHVLVARLWAAAHRHLGHVCDPAGQTDALGSCQAPAATAPCPATAPSPQPPALCPQPHSLLQELLGVLWRKAGGHQCHWSNGTRGPGKQVPPPPAPRFFQVTAAPSAQL